MKYLLLLDFFSKKVKYILFYFILVSYYFALVTRTIRTSSRTTFDDKHILSLFSKL